MTFAGTGDTFFNVTSPSTVLTLTGQILAPSTNNTAIEGGGTLVIANTTGTNTIANGGNGGLNGLFIADGGLVLNGTCLVNGTLRLGNNGPSSEFVNSANAFLNISSGTTTDTGSFFMAENNGLNHQETLNVQTGATLAVVGSGVFRTGFSSTANTDGFSVINISGGATFIGYNAVTLSNQVNTQYNSSSSVATVDTTFNIGDGTTANGPAVFTIPAITTWPRHEPDHLQQRHPPRQRQRRDDPGQLGPPDGQHPVRRHDPGHPGEHDHDRRQPAGRVPAAPAG